MIDISVSGLVKEFEVGKRILDGLTFQVDAGERVGLLGPNGCGKTTLLRILTGEVRPDEGEVVLAPGRRVGLISQIPVYPPEYTVEDVLDAAFTPLREMERDVEVHILLAGCGELRDEGLRAKFGGATPAETVKAMLLPGEIADLSRAVERLSGYRQNTIREIKNG